MIFWDRTKYCIIKKRLESGTFHLVQKAKEGRGHVEINSAELALILEGIELEGAKRRKRYVPQVEPQKRSVRYDSCCTNNRWRIIGAKPIRRPNGFSNFSSVSCVGLCLG